MSSAPIAMDAAASQTPDPVSWRSARPAAASTSPITAAVSSNSAAFTVVSGLRCTCSTSPVRPRRASPRICEYARMNDMPSATPARASTI